MLCWVGVGGGNRAFDMCMHSFVSFFFFFGLIVTHLSGGGDSLFSLRATLWI